MAGPVLMGAAMLVLWFVFAGTVSWHELLAGVGSSALAAVGWRIASRRSRTVLRGRAWWILPALRLPIGVAADTARLLVVLARQLFQGRAAPSLFVALPFDPGGRDPVSAMRRALAIAYTGVTPGTVVIGVDPGRRVMLVHRVRHGEPPGPGEALGNPR